MPRQAVNLMAFFVPFFVMVALGVMCGGCSSPSQRRAGISSECDYMPVNLGDSSFRRWAGSSPLQNSHY